MSEREDDWRLLHEAVEFADAMDNQQPRLVAPILARIQAHVEALEGERDEWRAAYGRVAGRYVSLHEAVAADGRLDAMYDENTELAALLAGVSEVHGSCRCAPCIAARAALAGETVP